MNLHCPSHPRVQLPSTSQTLRTPLEQSSSVICISCISQKIFLNNLEGGQPSNLRCITVCETKWRAGYKWARFTHPLGLKNPSCQPPPLRAPLLDSGVPIRPTCQPPGVYHQRVGSKVLCILQRGLVIVTLMSDSSESDPCSSGNIVPMCFPVTLRAAYFIPYWTSCAVIVLRPQALTYSPATMIDPSRTGVNRSIAVLIISLSIWYPESLKLNNSYATQYVLLSMNSTPARPFWTRRML